jgi:hypothetical protein
VQAGDVLVEANSTVIGAAMDAPSFKSVLKTLGARPCTLRIERKGQALGALGAGMGSNADVRNASASAPVKTAELNDVMQGSGVLAQGAAAQDEKKKMKSRPVRDKNQTKKRKKKNNILRAPNGPSPTDSAIPGSDSDGDEFGDAQNSDNEHVDSSVSTKKLHKPVLITDLEGQLKSADADSTLQKAKEAPAAAIAEWQEVLDASNKPYYWHKPSNQTTYEQPVGVPIIGVSGAISTV